MDSFPSSSRTPGQPEARGSRRRLLGLPWAVWGVLLAGGPVFLLLAGVLVTEAGRGVSGDRGRREERLKTLDAEVRQVEQTAHEQFEKGNFDGAAATQALNRMASSLDKAAASTGGDEAGCLQTSKVLHQQLAAHVQRYYEALGAVTRESPMDPVWAKTRADLARCRGNIKAMQAQVEGMRKFFKDLPNRARAELTARRVTLVAADRFMLRFSGQLERSRPLFEASRDDDDKGAVLLLQVVDLLEREWGRWRIEADGALAFESDQALETFQKLSTAIDETAAHQTKMQQEYVRAMGN